MQFLFEATRFYYFNNRILLILIVLKANRFITWPFMLIYTFHSHKNGREPTLTFIIFHTYSPKVMRVLHYSPGPYVDRFLGSLGPHNYMEAVATNANHLMTTIDTNRKKNRCMQFTQRYETNNNLILSILSLSSRSRSVACMSSKRNALQSKRTRVFLAKKYREFLFEADCLRY